MRVLSYMVTSILVISWFIGFFVFSAGIAIHMFLVLALIVVLPTFAGGRGL